MILTIGWIKYNIHNYNIRGFTENTARELRDSFRDSGLLAAVEYIGSKATYRPSINTFKKPRIKEKPKVVEKPKKEIRKIEPFSAAQAVQISMFDILQN